MPNIFGNITADGLEQAQDRLGGFKVYESNAYTGTIKAAYGGQSANSKAQSITVILDLENNGGEYREAFWITDKENKNYFLNKADNSKKVPLPGFVCIEDLCLVTTDKPLHQQIVEEKVMKIWDTDAKKELPKAVPMLVELLGKKVTFGVVKELVNKRVKNTTTGQFEEVADYVEQNSTDKVFHYPSNMTVVEARQGMTVATFFQAWVEKNKGNIRDRRSIRDGNTNGGKPGRPGGGNTPPKAGETPPKTPSLFN